MSLKTPPAIQVYFNQRLLKIVQKYGKTMVGWDEILVPGLPTDAVIQSWRGQKSLVGVGGEGISRHPLVGLLSGPSEPRFVSLRCGPAGRPGRAGLTPEQASRIMGGEACMWAELVGPETVDSRVWPRTAAIAERLWSPARRHGRGRDVRAPGRGEPQPGIHRRDASRLLPAHAGPDRRQTSLSGRCA